MMDRTAREILTMSYVDMLDHLLSRFGPIPSSQPSHTMGICARDTSASGFSVSGNDCLIIV